MPRVKQSKKDFQVKKEISIPITLIKLLDNLENSKDFRRVEGVRDSIGLIDEWIKYFSKLIKQKQPLGPKDLELADFIHTMINGLKRFRGKDYRNDI